MAQTIELLDTAELIGALSDLNIEDADTREGRIEAARAYRVARANLEISWQAWLRAEYLPGAPESVHASVFNIAWNEGHSSGYGDVESIYIDLAALANLVRRDWV